MPVHVIDEMEETQLPQGSPPWTPNTPSQPQDAGADSEPEQTISVTVTLAGKTNTFTLPSTSLLEDLTDECADAWGIEYDWTSHKFIAPPPVGLLKFAERASFPLAQLDGKKVRLLASKVHDVDALRAAEQSAKQRAGRREAQRRAGRRHQPARTQRPSLEGSTYTFLQLRPLPNLPNPQRSLDFLTRLKNDPGIRAAMRAHKFSVGLLTEMDPLSYTQESVEGTTRILGLNRNKGEVIELRLRTDAYDGYRDYKTIRKTLCHELAHNVHGPHDRNFWDLCHQIEREVDRADWKSGGRSVGEGPVYDPNDREEDVMDHGGWAGGEFVLGGGGSGSASGASSTLSRREILAKAAEERVRRMNEERRNADNGEGASK